MWHGSCRPEHCEVPGGGTLWRAGEGSLVLSTRGSAVSGLTASRSCTLSAAECMDSGSDDSSPDAHDSSMASTEVGSPVL